MKRSRSRNGFDGQPASESPAIINTVTIRHPIHSFKVILPDNCIFRNNRIGNTSTPVIVGTAPNPVHIPMVQPNRVMVFEDNKLLEIQWDEGLLLEDATLTREG